MLGFVLRLLYFLSGREAFLPSSTGYSVGLTDEDLAWVGRTSKEATRKYRRILSTTPA